MYTIKEAGIMWLGLEAHLEDNPFDHIVHTVFSSGDSSHLLGKLGLQLEVF